MPMTGAEAILRTLRAGGIDYLFTNPGSDFAPVIEAYAAGPAEAIPDCITAPHENICISMAHGHYLATGRMQAAMVHVNVGLANAAMGLLNAHADDVPILMLSGRTPVTEHDRPGARRTPIQYGQEMFDQTALVREAVKWDVELRYAENAAALTARAMAVARTAPTGATYLSLPREPLCETVPDDAPLPVPPAPSAPQPEPTAIARLAAALDGARHPVILCSRGDAAGAIGRDLAALADENDIAVAEVFATRNVMATGHRCMIGPDTARHFAQADVVVVLDTPVAWIEARGGPAATAEVVHVGPDPLFARMPVRSYRATAAIAADTAAAVAALRAALPGRGDARRRDWIAAEHARHTARMDAMAADGATGVANKAHVARMVSAAVGAEGVIFNERGGPAPTFRLDGPNRWFGNTQAGGLGWCLPAAMGYQLADRDRLVAAVIGDGSYLFANPVACHQVMLANDLPVLTVVLDNGGWDAVRTSTLEVYPDGAAARANAMPMVPFAPAPDHAGIAERCGCFAQRVARAEDLAAALDAACAAIRDRRCPALVEVAVRPE